LPPGLVVTLDGATIPEASLGSALPVDPGAHSVVLKAPGYRQIKLDGEVPQGPITVTLDVPALEREPERPQAKVQPIAPAALEQSPPGTTQRTLGWALGGLGVLSFASAGILAYRAHDLDTESRAHCLADDPNLCNAEGTSLREQARTFGNVATAATIAGAALTATGVVLLITAPSRSRESDRVQLGAHFGPTTARLVVSGRL
jgi:hypothetical protein